MLNCWLNTLLKLWPGKNEYDIYKEINVISAK